MASCDNSIRHFILRTMSDDVGAPAEPADETKVETRTLSILPRLPQSKPTPDGKTTPIPNEAPLSAKVEEPTLQEWLGNILQEAVSRRYDPNEIDEEADVTDPNSPAVKRGRRPFKVDEKVVYAMALNGTLQREIASFFGCSIDVIKKRFGDVYAQGKAARKIMLRQGQTITAMQGNAAMLIWLGKQELKQVDESRIRIGNLSSYSDEELEQLARGRLPGQLNRKDRVDNPDERD